MKKILYIAFCFLVVASNAQQPFINSLDKISGTANEVVTISGAGFVATPEVYFGNGKSTGVTFVNANLIRASVPPTTTYGPVTVVNSNGLSVSSGRLFSMSFDIDAKAVSTFTRDVIVSQAISDQQPYDLCLCDFDDNGLLDAAITNLGSDNINIAQNGSTPTTASLPLSSISSIPALINRTANITCGDLNADGFPDLVATSLVAGEPFVHVFENNGAGSFTFTKMSPTLQLPTFNETNRQGKKIRIADIDGDGKPDLIVGSQTTGDDNVLIYRNTSSGSISFLVTPVTISIAGAANTGGLDVGDFDNDGKPDIVVVPFRQMDEVYLLRNTSIPGTISLSLEGTTGINTERANVEIGDFNNDGLNDLAITQTSGLEVFQNTGSFSFAPLNLSSLLLGGVTAWGLDIGDINGDGLVDVVVSSIKGNQIIYYRNSTSGSINFTVADQVTTAGPARNVRIGDLNADGKPDIAVADDSQSGVPGDFSFIINRSCMTPVITPNTGTFCNPTPVFNLIATQGEGIKYDWTISGGVTDTVLDDPTGVLDISAYNPGSGVDIMVSVSAEMADGCTNPGSTFTYTRGDTPPTAPTVSVAPLGITCLGENIVLTASTDISATYTWNGPGGFSRDIVNDNTLNVSAAWFAENLTSADIGAEAIMSGTYSVFIQGADCRSAEGTLDVTISGPPVTSIEVISCNAGSIGLEVPDFSSQFDYQWKQGTSDVGTNSPTFTATTPSSYTLEITDANLCTYTTNPVVVRSSSFIGPQSTALNEVCVGVQADFSANETGIGVTWEVDDPDAGGLQTFSGNTLSHTFPTTGSKVVRLITQYVDGVGCSEKTITVSADPAFAITPSATTKCSSDAVTLTLTGASTTSGDSWSWDDDDPTTDLSGEISNVLSTMIPATYTATYTSGTRCVTTTSSVTIANFAGIGVTATESTITNDTIIFAEDQTFVTLTADNSLAYIWTAMTPNGNDAINDIDDPGASTVVVTPSAPIITVTVSAQTLDGCVETTNTVIMNGSFLARRSFSPNGDGLNDIWSINNSRNLDGCRVFIFDSRGATIFSEDSPFANDEVWDGTHNGNPATEGVYYYVLKCDDSENNQTGAILVSR